MRRLLEKHSTERKHQDDLLGELEVDTSLSEHLLVRYLAARVAIAVADGDDGLVSSSRQRSVLTGLGRERNVQRLNTDGANAARNERIVALLEITGSCDYELENTSSSPGLGDVECEQEMNVLANRSRVWFGNKAHHIHAGAIAHVNRTCVNLLASVDEHRIQISACEKVNEFINPNAVAHDLTEILLILVGEIRLAEVSTVPDDAIVQDLVKENVDIGNALFNTKLTHRIALGNYLRRRQLGQALLERSNLGT